jgi:hypothetical protein
LNLLGNKNLNDYNRKETDKKMKQSKTDDIIQWIATIFTIAGATASSLDQFPFNIILFNIGSILWIISAIRIKNIQIIIVNSGLLLIYVIGFFRYFIGD